MRDNYACAITYNKSRDDKMFTLIMYTDVKRYFCERELLKSGRQKNSNKKP